MKIRGPQTLLGLILSGLALVTIPLLIAIGNAVYRLGQLTSDSRSVFEAGATTISLNRQVETLLIDMERNARRFVLQPGDEETLDLYLDAQGELKLRLQELENSSRSAEGVEIIDYLTAATNDIDEILTELPDDPEGISDQLLDTFIQMDQSAERLDQLMQQDMNLALESLQADTATAQEQLAWQAAALIPLLILLIVFFLLLIARPMRNIDRSIRELGDGDSRREIAISGPADIQTLGRRLEWLRNRLLESASEKDKFLRHMSHELKTPLANIREGSELLMDGSVGSLDRQQSEVAGILRTNSLKLQRLIENLLTYSTWQSKAATLETSTFDLQGLVRKVMSLHKLPISSRGIQLEVRVSDLLIHADENKLRLIVENLISNAVKFTPDGGNISLHAVANDCELVLDVRDNGPGIAAEDRDRIFEAFYQGQRIQGGPVGGTGIGLSIVLECVQAYKGAVELIDDPNSGAHFRVRLPIQVQAESKSRVANA